MSLHPDETIQKILISSTCRFIGEYDTDILLVTHAWPNFSDQASYERFQEGPRSRSGYIIVFRTPPLIREVGVAIPIYEGVGDIFSAYLSLLFGKRFDSHGVTEATGSFHVPNLSEFSQFCTPKLPQNSHSPRVDYPTRLNLEEIRCIECLLLDAEIDEKLRNTFQSATKFYHRALQNVETDYEIAYLNLITAGEILSNYIDFEFDHLVDAQMRSVLRKIEEAMPSGVDLTRQIKSRLMQIKRRFVLALCSLVDEDFFLRSEANEPYLRLKKDNLLKTVSAAYDLRSRYVHTGVSFGGWLKAPSRELQAEVQVGKPVMSDKNFAKILAAAPTYIGLERIIRYCLLRFAEKNGLFNCNLSSTIQGS